MRELSHEKRKLSKRWVIHRLRVYRENVETKTYMSIPIFFRTSAFIWNHLNLIFKILRNIRSQGNVIELKTELCGRIL